MSKPEEKYCCIKFQIHANSKGEHFNFINSDREYRIENSSGNRIYINYCPFCGTRVSKGEK